MGNTSGTKEEWWCPLRGTSVTLRSVRGGRCGSQNTGGRAPFTWRSRSIDRLIDVSRAAERDVERRDVAACNGSCAVRVVGRVVLCHTAQWSCTGWRAQIDRSIACLVDLLT